MAVLAERTFGRRRAVLSVGVAAAALLTVFVTAATAQQTVIIGGPAVIGSGASGLVVNNEVLESLGMSPQVPALPYRAPGGGLGAAPVMPVTPGGNPGLNLSPGLGSTLGPSLGTVPGIVYRQPDTGQLLVTRPGRLLFPPPRAPGSRLAAGTPAAPMATPEPELTSRLLVPPAPQPTMQPAQPMPPAPVEPVVAAPAPAPVPPPTVPPPEPAMPEPQVAAQPEPAMPEPALPEPSKAAEAPPAPSTLTEELTQGTAPAEPPPEPAAVATAEPLPPPEPVTPTPAAPAPAAPAPAAPAPAAAETEPPPPPAESLTSEPAVEPQTAALPSALTLAEQIRVLFEDASVELSDDAKRRLGAVATALQENMTMRVQLLAYAKASADGASRARRLSLSRALAVRAFLIERGVRSTRMDVRALGDKVGDGPADRVDILPQAAN